MKSDLTKIQEVWRVPLTGKVNEQVRKRVLHKFPTLSSCEQNSYLALGKYIDGTPERFYSREALRTYTEILERNFTENLAQFIKVLDESSNDIDRAVLTLNEICREDQDSSADNAGGNCRRKPQLHGGILKGALYLNCHKNPN